MLNPCIRPVTAGYSEKLLEIYSYYVENTAVSFETETPSPAEFSERIAVISSKYPYLVCLTGDEITGYAYASKHRERAAYRFDVDVSVYLRRDMRGMGLGTALYARLFEELDRRGYYNAYAAITLPNDQSISLHRKFGFAEIGVHHRTGYKFNKWHDVLWLEKAIKDTSSDPKIS